MRAIDADRLEKTWNADLTMIDNVEAQPTLKSLSKTSKQKAKNNIRKSIKSILDNSSTLDILSKKAMNVALIYAFGMLDAYVDAGALEYNGKTVSIIQDYIHKWLKENNYN